MGAQLKNNFIHFMEDETNVDVAAEETTDEVAKMLGKATQKAIETGAKATEAAMVKATNAIDALMETVVESADKARSKVALSGNGIKPSFDVATVKKGLAEIASGDRQSLSFEISEIPAQQKADFAYLAKSTDKADLTGDVIIPDLQPGMERAPVREVFIEQIADTLDTDKDYVSYVEVTGSTGNPATTLELGTIPQKEWTFQEFKKPVQKITVANKHSVEILNDGPELVNAIKGFLAEDMNIVTDDQLLSGNGTAPNLQGVLGVATDLNTLIGTQILVGATHSDVLRIGVTKIRTTGKGKFRPTHIVLNPVDVEAMELTKDTTGQYVLPPFIAADGSRIAGATVIENVGITAGTFLMGDFRKLHIRRRSGVEIEITNADGNDFLSDIITVKMRRRLVSYVKTNDNGAFLTGTFATIKTNLAS